MVKRESPSAEARTAWPNIVQWCSEEHKHGTHLSTSEVSTSSVGFLVGLPAASAQKFSNQISVPSLVHSHCILSSTDPSLSVDAGHYTPPLKLYPSSNFLKLILSHSHFGFKYVTILYFSSYSISDTSCSDVATLKHICITRVKFPPSYLLTSALTKSPF